MSIWKEYHQPQTIPQAISLLNTCAEPSSIIAGGTDLMLDLNQGNHAPVNALIDITEIPELKVIEIVGEEIVIGACVTHNQIVKNQTVLDNADALIEACGLIGGPQVRNSATIGGNVAHALPAADGTIGLLSLNTQVEISSVDGQRRIPITQFFVGPGKSILDPKKEFLTRFFIPLKQINQGSAFKRIMRAQGIALPILNLSVWIERSQDKIVDVRISIGPAGPVPFRAVKTEEMLKGMVFNDDAIAKAQQSILSEAKFRTSARRATSEYRQQLVTELFKNTIIQAWKRTF